MSHIGTSGPFAEIAFNKVPGQRIFWAMGSRPSIGSTTNGEDMWQGSATSMPEPADAGEQMTVNSTNAADTAAGTGVQEVTIEYIKGDGTEATEVIATNGGTVNTTATDIRFVNDFYGTARGSNGVAEGDIEIYKLGAATTIYNLIPEGGNKSLVSSRMVPIAKKLVLKEWHAEESKGKRTEFRIRSTDMSGVLYDGVFLFKGNVDLENSVSGPLALNILVPALSIVKVSAWADLTGAAGTCGWWGILRND